MNIRASPAKPAGSRERSLDEVKAEFLRRTAPDARMDQAPVDDIYLLLEHGNPKSARIYANGRHRGRAPGEPSDHITATIVEWLHG